ncbi:hypothetical protein TWF718_005244 [Orbilia javanica]|uniref:NB-ARC domain-containing protein n=1 Tax=Orbilia javanica TaxID=47235 RepID=A0AAN8MZZ9_9PEZI
MSTIGIAAAAFGITVGGTKIVASCYQLIKDVSDAPDSMVYVANKMEETITIVEGLHKFLKSQAAQEGTETLFIPFERLEQTMIGIMLCFSKLDKEMKFTQSRRIRRVKGLLRATWLFHEGTIKGLIERLDSHNTSLSLMLQLLKLQPRTSEETRRSLSEQIEKTVREDPDVQEHLRKHASAESKVVNNARRANTSLYDDEFREYYNKENSNPAIVLSGPSTVRLDQTSTETETTIKYGERPKSIQSRISQCDFQEILNSSRPYLRVLPKNPRASFISHDGSERGVTYSIFSQQSVVTISNIAVYNLPISPSDVNNSDWYVFNNSTSLGVPTVGPAKDGYSLSLNTIPEGATKTSTTPETSVLADLPPKTTTRVRAVEQPRLSSLAGSSRLRGNSPSLDKIHRPGNSSSRTTTSYYEYWDRNHPERCFVPNCTNERGCTCYPGYFRDLRSATSEFVQREEITAEIINKIKAPNNSKVTNIVLWGGLGCGKTEFALDFMNSVPHLPNVQKFHKIFLHVEEGDNIEKDLSYIAARVGIDVDGVDNKTNWFTRQDSSTTQTQEAEALWNWLAATEEHWVLILDDVIHWDSLSKWTRLANPNGTLIITTRVKPPEGTALAVEVGLFTETQAIAVAQKCFSDLHKFPIMVGGPRSKSPARLNDFRFLGFDQTPDLLPVEIPAFIRTAASKNIDLGDLMKYRIRESIRKECGVRDGYRLATHGLGSREKLYLVMWDSFKRQDKEWDLDMPSNARSKKWSTRRTMTDIAAFLFPNRCSLKLLESADQYFYERRRPNATDARRLQDGNLPLILIPNPSDQDTANIPKLAQISYIQKMSYERGCYIVSKTASWLFDSIQAGTNSQPRLSVSNYLYHLETLINNLLDVLEQRFPYRKIDFKDFFELARVLRRTLELHSTNQIRPELTKILRGTLERIITPIITPQDYPSLGALGISDLDYEYFCEVADSSGFMGNELIKQGNRMVALECFKLAKNSYKFLCYHQEAVNKSIGSLDGKPLMRIYDRARMHSCELKLAQCLRDQNRIGDSIRYIQKARRDMETPVDCILGLFKYFEGDLHLSMQKYGDAIFCYEGAVNSIAKCPRAQESCLAAIEGKRALIFIHFGKWKRAIKSLQSALDLITSSGNAEGPHNTRQRAWINAALANAYRELLFDSGDIDAINYANSAWRLASSLDHEAPKLMTEGLHLTDHAPTWQYYDGLYQKLDFRALSIAACPELNRNVAVERGSPEAVDEFNALSFDDGFSDEPCSFSIFVGIVEPDGSVAT